VDELVGAVPLPLAVLDPTAPALVEVEPPLVVMVPLADTLWESS
jgi:hypothetical protein